jgi:tetratricopeptide (TPR) repeat protein
MPKIGRNDPCPCGSGQKYKRCCMDKSQAVARPKHADLQGQQQARIEDLAAAMEEADELDDAPNSVVDLSFGNVHQTHGDPAEAESSLLVHLELYAWLGSKEGMAAAYSNLGTVYQTLGDLAPAEAMYKEALKLDEALGRKEEMASAYGNLGRVYQTRGDLAQAAAMYNESIALFQQVGATPQVQQLQDLADKLTGARAASSAGK